MDLAVSTQMDLGCPQRSNNPTRSRFFLLQLCYSEVANTRLGRWASNEFILHHSITQPASPNRKKLIVQKYGSLFSLHILQCLVILWMTAIYK